MIRDFRKNIFFQWISAFCLVTFTGTTLISPAHAQSIFAMPPAGAMVSPTTGYTPFIIKGMTLHPDNPLQFSFLFDTGDTDIDVTSPVFEEESKKLVKYFMATLTVPDDEMWVNLSPQERDRIVADGLSQTDLGRDMLAQDYLLKQFTASMIYPEEELGRTFWGRVYQKAHEQYGTTEIPLDTFHKVWIVPEGAEVYERHHSVFNANSRLKVMLDRDYWETQGEKIDAQGNGISTDIMREVIIPEIEREVNEGKHFAQIRQIYSAMILATWYKRNLKESLLGQIYADRNKVVGIDLEDKNVKEKIYEQYVSAFEQGVFDYIKEENDPWTQEMLLRHYFSGGIQKVGRIDSAMNAGNANDIAGQGVEATYAFQDFGVGADLKVIRKAGDRAMVIRESSFMSILLSLAILFGPFINRVNGATYADYVERGLDPVGVNTGSRVVDVRDLLLKVTMLVGDSDMSQGTRKALINAQQMLSDVDAGRYLGVSLINLHEEFVVDSRRDEDNKRFPDFDTALVHILNRFNDAKSRSDQQNESYADFVDNHSADDIASVGVIVNVEKLFLFLIQQAGSNAISSETRQRLSDAETMLREIDSADSEFRYVFDDVFTNGVEGDIDQRIVDALDRLKLALDQKKNREAMSYVEFVERVDFQSMKMRILLRTPTSVKDLLAYFMLVGKYTEISSETKKGLEDATPLLRQIDQDPNRQEILSEIRRFDPKEMQDVNLSIPMLLWILRHQYPNKDGAMVSVRSVFVSVLFVLAFLFGSPINKARGATYADYVEHGLNPTGLDSGSRVVDVRDLFLKVSMLVGDSGVSQETRTALFNAQGMLSDIDAGRLRGVNFVRLHQEFLDDSHRDVANKRFPNFDTAVVYILERFSEASSSSTQPTQSQQVNLPLAQVPQSVNGPTYLDFIKAGEYPDREGLLYEMRGNIKSMEDLLQVLMKMYRDVDDPNVFELSPESESALRESEPWIRKLENDGVGASVALSGIHQHLTTFYGQSIDRATGERLRPIGSYPTLSHAVTFAVQELGKGYMDRFVATHRDGYQQESYVDFVKRVTPEVVVGNSFQNVKQVLATLIRQAGSNNISSRTESRLRGAESILREIDEKGGYSQAFRTIYLKYNRSSDIDEMVNGSLDILEKAHRDSALVGVEQKKNVGGIDLDSELLDLQIHRDENGVPLPVFQQPLHEMNIQGLFPIMIDRSPINIPLFISQLQGKDDAHRSADGYEDEIILMPAIRQKEEEWLAHAA